MTRKSDHHVEAFREDGTPGYGWQCFTCGEEKKGFTLLPQAEADALNHGILPHQYPFRRDDGEY